MNNNKKGTIIIISVVIIILLIIVASFIWYKSSISAVSKENSDIVTITVEKGETLNKILSNLEENGLIKNSFAAKIYTKLHGSVSVQAGNYEISKSDDLATILDILENKTLDNSKQITFVEGKNMRYIASTIASNTNNTEEDVYNLLEDEDYINELIDKYWFLTDEIKDSRIYYPLEGYLFPDTYSIKSDDVTVKEIFETILDHTEKVLDEYKEQIENSSLTVHQILTFASITELEGNDDESRAEIIGVFYNRIKAKMPLGSDVTAYYGVKKELADGDITAKELAQDNGYNTRISEMAGKIPVGPICNPGKSSIEATLNYKETDAYYFVADKNGKIYFTNNYDEHTALIQKLKKEGLWFTY